MKIFTALEEKAFESPPVFNSVERKRFFSLPLMLKNSMEALRTPTNKVCFLVTAGYFKARRKFFGWQFREADIEYVARQIGADPSDVHVESYSKETYSRHQSTILSHFGCSPFDEAAKTFIATEIAARIGSLPQKKRRTQGAVARSDSQWLGCHLGALQHARGVRLLG